jgi:hypothetical protein
LRLALGAGAFLTVAGSARPAAAEGGPPFLTDDPGTPGAGRWEINVALTFEHRPDDYLLQVPDLDVNYGLGDYVQLKYETAWNVAGTKAEGTQSALGNSHLGVKWRFVDRKDASFDLSVYPQFDFNPMSSAEFGLIDRSTELLLAIEAAAELGPIETAAEVGYNLVFGETDGVIYGFVAGHSFEHVFLGAEVHGEADINFEDDELVLNVGANIDLPADLNLLASAGRSPRGAASGEPDLLAYLGLQIHL